ncbi:putative damage-inducible protein DinB [Micromonospora sp. A200]|uniref:DinB family protein n=1 Tax=Micromonospora sp. A200 TaxID=2940568 RepID=UPI002476AB9D|nr:DinB family protein [Micromonospora sp. A200]MDH6460719.1 putative damage-inducible protein DinB [Micromonospora sp. A200]
MPDTRFPVLLDGPGNHVDDPRELLVGYLDWYREALARKTAGLSEEQLRGPVDGLGWAPLGLVRHLGWVERRWIRWGFAAEQVAPCPPGEDDAEWRVDALSTEQVWRAYRAEVAHTRRIVARVPLSRRAALGGRFHAAADAPSLGRILFHLLQEYARHLGQLDVARQLLDGVTGE